MFLDCSERSHKNVAVVLAAAAVLGDRRNAEHSWGTYWRSGLINHVQQIGCGDTHAAIVATKQSGPLRPLSSAILAAD
jgi:hypothetical protein